MRDKRQRITIRLVYDPPPIPTRDCDWRAYDDDSEGECSHGATPYDALRALADDMEARNA